jgi:hypothetical protein
MSNYVKATNFYTKDALLTGNPNKIIKGSEIDDEYNAIATAIASKADTTSPTFTGTPVAPTASAGTNTTQLATTAFTTSAILVALATIYPIGSIYTSTVATNPNSLFGFGTWTAFGAGRVLVGNGGGFTAGATGGSADAVVVSHTHTATSTVTDPGHVHNTPNGEGTSSSYYPTGNYDGNRADRDWNTSAATTGITVGTTITSAGVSGVNANLQPYVVVYMWQRTA